MHNWIYERVSAEDLPLHGLPDLQVLLVGMTAFLRDNNAIVQVHGVSGACEACWLHGSAGMVGIEFVDRALGEFQKKTRR